MKLHSIPFEDICISENRQRKNLPTDSLLELAGSITNVGLIHPIVVRKDADGRIMLVAGERRLRALEYIWNFGQSVRCGEYNIPPHQVPCVYLGDIDPVKAYEIELEENIRRLDITWQERSASVAQLARYKALSTGVEPTHAELAEEIGLSPSSTGGGGSGAMAIRHDLILAKFLHDPDIAAAKSRSEGFKILKRKEEAHKNAELGRKVEQTLAGEHRLIRNNCLDAFKTMEPKQFDVILSDPPYGMGADEFGDSAGVGGATGGHFYDDSYESWKSLMNSFIFWTSVLSKPQAHMYLFCDIDRFAELREIIRAQEDWNVFRTPLIWFNPGGSRAPWPQSGPQRKYQVILYANKGNKPVTALLGDVIASSSDANLGHPAQKPVAVYSDLLHRSVRPGDNVLDPFAGTGTIFPAAHGLKCRATGIEQDERACGIAMERLGQLK